MYYCGINHDLSSFIFYFIWALSIFFLISLAKDLLILFIFSKNKFLVSLIFIQKSVAFLCTNNKISEREVQKTIPFTITSKIIKYPRILKETKDKYTKNDRMLMKEVEKAPNIWQDIPCLQIGRINIGKMIILPKAIYRFNEILSNYQ